MKRVYEVREQPRAARYPYPRGVLLSTHATSSEAFTQVDALRRLGRIVAVYAVEGAPNA